MAELAPGWTPYRYGFNNPVKFIDPDGMFEYSDGYSTQDSKNSTGAISFSGSYIERTINTDYIEFSTGTGDNRQVLGGYTETYLAESGTVLNRKYFGSPVLFGAGGFGDKDGGKDSFLPMSQGGGPDIGRPLSTGAINPDYTIEGFTLPIFGFLKALNLGRIAARSSTATARSLGIAGEKAVGITGPKTAINVAGRTRIPDAMTRTTLTEVKNVKSLSFTRQLRDFHSFSQQTGRDFILYTRPNTTLSGPLQNAINQGTIIHRYIPF